MEIGDVGLTLNEVLLAAGPVWMKEITRGALRPFWRARLRSTSTIAARLVLSIHESAPPWYACCVVGNYRPGYPDPRGSVAPCSERAENGSKKPRAFEFRGSFWPESQDRATLKNLGVCENSTPVSMGWPGT